MPIRRAGLLFGTGIGVVLSSAGLDLCVAVPFEKDFVGWS
jgi:hypothetical protein